MTYPLQAKVSVLTEHGLQEGWVRGRAFSTPMRYDVQVDKELLLNLPEEKLRAVAP